MSLQPTLIRSRSGFESLNGATGVGGRGEGGGGGGNGGGGIAGRDGIAASGTNGGHVGSEVGAGNVGASVPPFVTVVVLLAGIVGGLVLVLSVIVCCKYCLPSKPALQKRSSENLSPAAAAVESHHGRYRPHSASSSSRHRINPESREAAMQLCLPLHPAAAAVTCSPPQTYSGEMAMAPSPAPTNGMGSNGGSIKSQQQVLETIDFQIISETPFLKQCLGERQQFATVQDDGTKAINGTRTPEGVTIEILKGEDGGRGASHESPFELRLQLGQGDSQRQGEVGLGARMGRGHLGPGEGDSGAAGDGSISYDEDSSAVSELTPMLSFAGQDAFHSPNRKEQLCVGETSHQPHHQHHPHRSSAVQPQQSESHKREVFVEVYPTPRSTVCSSSSQSTTSRTELFRGIHTKSFSDQEISQLTRDRRIQQFILLEVFSVALFKPPKPVTEASSTKASDHRPAAAAAAASDATSSVIDGPIPSPAQVNPLPIASAAPEFQLHSSPPPPPCAPGQRDKRNESMPELWKAATAPCSEALRPYSSDTRLLSPKSQRHCPLHNGRHNHQHPYHRQHLTQQQQLQQQQEFKKLLGSCCSQTPAAVDNSEKVEAEVVVQQAKVPQDLWQLRAILANETEADSEESEGIAELTSVDFPPIDAVAKESWITLGTPSKSPEPSHPVCCSQSDQGSPNTIASVLACQSTAALVTPGRSKTDLGCSDTVSTDATGHEICRHSEVTSGAVDSSTLPDNQPTPATASGEAGAIGTIAEKDEDTSGAVAGDPLHREPSIRRLTYRKAIAQRQRRHELLPPKPDDEGTDTESSLSLEKSASIPAASTSVESFRDSTTSTDSTGENHAYRLEQLRGDSGYKSLETQQSLGTRFDFRQTYFVPEESSIIREDEPVSPLPLQPIGKAGSERRTETTVFLNDAVALLSKISPSMPTYLCYPHSGATKRALKSKAAEKKRSQYKSDRQAVQVYDSVHEQELPPVSGGTSTVTSHQHGSPSTVTGHHFGSSSTVTTHHHGSATCVATLHQLSSTLASSHHHQEHSTDAAAAGAGAGGDGDSGKQSSTKSSSSSLFSRLLKSHSRRPLVRMHRDYSIDERSDALFNEFMRHDPTYDTKQRTLCTAMAARSPVQLRSGGHRRHRSRSSARSSTDLPGQQGAGSGGDATAPSEGPSTAAAAVASSAELRRRRHEARRRQHETRDAVAAVEDSVASSTSSVVTDCQTMFDALNRKSISDSRTTKALDDDETDRNAVVEGLSEMGKLSAVEMVGEGSSGQQVPRLSPTICRNRNIPLIQLTEDEDV